MSISAIATHETEPTSRPAAAAVTSAVGRGPGPLAERLRVAEAAVRQTAQLALVGQMTAVLIHEVSNPVASIQSALHLLTRLPPDHPSYARVIELLRDQAAHLSAITARMRDLYHPEEGERAECDLGALLTQTLTLAEPRLREMHVSVTWLPSPAPALVAVDRVQMRQLFLNLIVNAIDAMPAGGEITARLLAQAGAVTVEIQDTGGGIAPDILGHLFEPFVTSKPSGSGLGLYVSAQMAADHGGWIEAQRIESGGSLFRVVLPSSARGAESHQALRPKGAAPGELRATKPGPTAAGPRRRLRRGPGEPSACG